MANITIEIPDALRDDFIKATSSIQDKYYVAQASEPNPEKRNKILETFMDASNILDRLQKWD